MAKTTFVVIDAGFPTAARKDQKGRLIGLVYKARVGEDHQHAKLSDAQVEEIRTRYEAHDAADPDHEGYRVLASAYGVSKRTIRDIVACRRRNTWPEKWKRVDK